MINRTLAFSLIIAGSILLNSCGSSSDTQKAPSTNTGSSTSQSGTATSTGSASDTAEKTAAEIQAEKEARVAEIAAKALDEKSIKSCRQIRDKEIASACVDQYAVSTATLTSNPKECEQSSSSGAVTTCFETTYAYLARYATSERQCAKVSPILHKNNCLDRVHFEKSKTIGLGECESIKNVQLKSTCADEFHAAAAKLLK